MKDFLKIFEEEYRSSNLIKKVSQKIEKISSNLGEVKIMNFCGTHEHTITYFGLRTLLPENIKLIAGPGCPVCITPAKDIDEVIKLALNGVRVYTYGDIYRAPGSKMSLQDARLNGGDVKIVYSFLDALKMARKDRKESVFFAVGFETTVPTVAPFIVKNMVPENLTILLSYHLTPPAMRKVLTLERDARNNKPLKGVIAPGHVSTIIGARSWSFVAEEFHTPIVVAGFEPLDVMLAVYEILKQNSSGEAFLVNEYGRVVRWEGNLTAQRYMEEAFTIEDGIWRGIGEIPKSVYAFKSKFSKLDARREYNVEVSDAVDYRPGCKCAEITIGKIYPTDCPFFLKTCTPSKPLGPCMVSVEGTCSIWARFGGSDVKKLLKINQSKSIN